MAFMTVEALGIGKSGQEQGTNATAIQQRLQSLIGELENSRSSFDGNAGTAFVRAKNQLMEQFGLLMQSQGKIAGGLGDSQRHVTTGDTTSEGDVSGANAAISGVNSVVNINA